MVKEVKGKEDKVLGLLESNSGHSEVSFKGDDLSIVLPQAMLFDTNAAMLKFLSDHDQTPLSVVKYHLLIHEPRVIPDLEGDDSNDDEDLSDFPL